MDEPTKARQRRFLTLAVLFITICYQYTTVLMTSKSTKQAQTTEGDGEKDKSERAVWKGKETTELLIFLKAKNSEITDGGQFKKSTFNAAATHIRPYLEAGPIKTGGMCKTKWGTVRRYTCPTLISSDH
jgi:hypothetical protein